MSTREPLQNLYLFGDITGIDIEEGINKCGSRRGFFDELNNFEQSARKITDKLKENPSTKIISAYLSSLYERLLSICEGTIASKVEFTINLIKDGGQRSSILENVKNITADILQLCEKIQDVLLGNSPMKTLKKTDSDDKEAKLCVPDVVIKQATTQAAHAPQEIKSGKKVILAIDDMPDILKTLKSLLENEYSVYCVTNHLAALKFLANNTADIILLDIEMPDMDGFTLLKILRQMEPCKSTPVLFLTGNVSIENVMASIKAGGNDFIKKPIDYNILVQKIEKNLLK